MVQTEQEQSLRGESPAQSSPSQQGFKFAAPQDLQVGQQGLDLPVCGRVGLDERRQLLQVRTLRLWILSSIHRESVKAQIGQWRDVRS